MDKFANNGTELSEFETPFTDYQVQSEDKFENHILSYPSELESPFRFTYETLEGGGIVSTPSSDAFVELLAELNNPDFETILYDLVAEAEDTFSSRISDEFVMGENYIPFVTQQINQYFEPLTKETERIFDEINNHFSGNNLADYNESEIDQLFEKFELEHIQLSPAQDQFLGSIIKKAKSVVNAGVKLAKKGISTVGKILPINQILGKLKKFIKPLLERVLRFAINKLPKNYQSQAQALAKKFLKLETTSSYENASAGGDDLESIQYELDNNIVSLLFLPDEPQSESLIQDYLTSSEVYEREISYETSGLNIPSLSFARKKFITNLRNLKQGESPIPSIEEFIPVALMAARPIIKMAITIIGRPKVIDFLAGLLAKLIDRYIPESVAKPLASKIIDVGMSIIGFETYEAESSELAYEAIASTIEQTVQNLGPLNESVLNDQEALTSLLLESFESAAANNFPSSYIKPGLRKSRQPGLWILMPRKSSRHYYKKFTHVFPVTIDSSTANSVTTFRGIPLTNFLRDKLGLDISIPIEARVHLYEAIDGTLLSRISRSENIPGLGPSQPYGWIQIHPLTVQAASVLLKEPGLGKDLTDEDIKNRRHIKQGQRFYFLEINGAKLKLPQISRKSDLRDSEVQETIKRITIVPRSSDVQCVINFIRAEIKFNYFFSEEDAKSIVERLNRNDFIGASILIRNSVRNVLNNLLIKNVCHKVKIVHESIPEMYLDNIKEEDFAPLAALGSLALNAGKEVLKKIIEKLVEKISEQAYRAVVNYFKARVTEFKQAQAAIDDGVTIKIIWSNIPGMSTIRTIINAVRGKLSVGNLTNLTLPNIPVPEVKIFPGKKFD